MNNGAKQQHFQFLSKILELILEGILAYLCFGVDMLGLEYGNPASEALWFWFRVVFVLKFLNDLLLILGIELVQRLVCSLKRHWNSFLTTVLARIEKGFEALVCSLSRLVLKVENVREKCASRRKQCAYKSENDPGAS